MDILNIRTLLRTKSIYEVGKSLCYYVFEATSDSYAKALANSTWTNATASVDAANAKVVYIVATDPAKAVSAKIGAKCGFTKVECHKDALSLTPVIKPASTSITVPSNGGEQSITYTIQYPEDGKALTAVSSETWINSINCGTAGTVTFVADANEGAERNATITLSYPGAEDVAVTVSQSAKGAVVTDYSTVYTSNLKFTAGKKVKIGGKEYDAVQLGTSKKSGQITFNVPAGTKKLCLHVVGWNDEGGKTHTIATSVGKISSSSITTTADTGATGNNSTFTLSKTDYSGKEYYFEFTLTNVTAESKITIKNSAGNSRGVYFGINAE